MSADWLTVNTGDCICITERYANHGWSIARRSYGVVLWYPAYVRNINELKDKMDFEAFCTQNVSTPPDSLQLYDGCHNTTFEGVTFESFGLSNWRISATFSNVTFHEVNFTNVVFKDCEFRNCKIRQVRFNSTYLVNSIWEDVALESVTFSSSDVCGLVAQNTSVEGLLTMSNVDVNGRRISNETQVNRTLFLQLVESDSNATCLNSNGYGDVKCGEVDDNRVYRDNFFVAASALPGNLVSAAAVYFLRRNYWLGELYGLCMWGGGGGGGGGGGSVDRVLSEEQITTL